MKTETSIVVRPPPFPEALRYLWGFFQEIIGGLPGNGWSVPIVNWTELECWSRLTRQEVSPRDARTIIRLGVMRANILSEKPKTNGGKG